MEELQHHQLKYVSGGPIVIPPAVAFVVKAVGATAVGGAALAGANKATEAVNGGPVESNAK